MFWILSAIALGYISIYAAFRELNNDICTSALFRAFRGSIALALGICCSTIFAHHLFFEANSYSLQIIPISSWLIGAIAILFVTFVRGRIDCNEHSRRLNIYSGTVSLLCISLTMMILFSNPSDAYTAFATPSFWAWSLISGTLITFSFYACNFVSGLLKRPSMLNYRYFTRPLMLTVCLVFIQFTASALDFHNRPVESLNASNLAISREQFILSIAVLSSCVISFLLASNFYVRHFGSGLKYIQELIYSRPSTHTFWQAFITLLSLSMLVISLILWFQWSSSLRENKSIIDVKLGNASSAVHSEIQKIVNDIRTFKGSFPLDINDLLESESQQRKLQHFFEGYSLSSNQYLYISILDDKGNELARLDNTASEPLFSLQEDFSDINYALEDKLSHTLAGDDFFVSQVKLATINNEPLSPAIPILNIGQALLSNQGTHEGTLVFTYRFERMSDQLKQIFSNNEEAFLLSESNRILIDLTANNDWNHLTRFNLFRFLDLKQNDFVPGTIYSDKQHTYILESASIARPLNDTLSSHFPNWRIAVKLSYPAIEITQSHKFLIFFLLFGCILLAHFISNTVLSNLSNKRKISELLNEVGYQKKALDEHAIVSITDTKGNITYVNDKFCEISGFSRDELIGQNHRILKSDEHSPDFFRELWKTIANGKVWSGEIKNFRKNGNIYWVNATILPIRNTSGKIERYIAIRTDITETRAISSILEDALKEAHQASEAKNRFLANISHEIRTPMNAIIGLTEACITTPNQSNQLELMRKVNVSANNLMRIINDILDFSKMEAGKLDVENISFSLEKVVEEYVFVHQSTAKAKNIYLMTGIDSNAPTQLIGDPLRIGQILSNLVGNAIKFTQSGEVIVYIKALRTKGDFVDLEFSVSDTGAGMSEDQITKLFSPFSQADASTTRKYGGTGLGLSICKSLVDLMGGEISVESRLDEGSIFRFHLPMKFDDYKASLPISEELKQSSVLLIDFVGVNTQNYIHHIDDFNMAIQVASSHIEIQTQLKSVHPFDYVIVDSYHISDELEPILTSLKDYQATSHFKKLILIDHGNEHRSFAQSTQQATLLSPPISQSTLLDCMISFERSESGDATSYPLPLNKSADERLAQLKVLIAEDNEINQLVISEILRQWGVEFVIANNGLEAISAVQQGSFDLVLMDIQMPILDGYEACRRIRALEGDCQSLPIIAVTANTSNQDIQLAVNAGMNTHVSKPINRLQLRDTILKLLDSYEAEHSINTHVEMPIDPLKMKMIEALPSMDIQKSLDRLGIESQFYLNLLTSFRESAEIQMQKAELAIEEDNLLELERAFHTLKGVAGNLGAISIFQHSKKLEEDIRNAQFSQKDFTALIADVEEYCKAIDTLSSTLHRPALPNHVSKNKESSLTLDECQTLLSLINAYDIKANSMIHKLVEEQSETDIYVELNEIEKQLKRYNFEEAAQMLSKIMSSLERSI